MTHERTGVTHFGAYNYPPDGHIWFKLLFFQCHCFHNFLCSESLSEGTFGLWLGRNGTKKDLVYSIGLCLSYCHSPIFICCLLFQTRERWSVRDMHPSNCSTSEKSNLRIFGELSCGNYTNTVPMVETMIYAVDLQEKIPARELVGSDGTDTKCS